MSHELQFVNGEASYAGREPAWHQLGTVISDLDYDTALRRAHLADWNVRALPFTALLGDDHDGNVPLREFITVGADEHQIIVRDNPGSGTVESLGIVGDRYNPVQNEEAFAVAPFLEDLGAVVETAGAIRGGRQVFLSMSLGGGFVLDPEGANDRVQGYLLLRTSHDGSLAVEACSTFIRVVCANTFDMTLGKDTPRAYKVRHTATAQDRLAQAQAILLRANGYGLALGELAQKLHRVPMTNAEFIDLVTDIYEEPESKRGKTLWEAKVDLLGDLFSGGGDVEYTLGNVAGTAWAGANALTERIDWHRKARGGDGTSLAVAASGFTANITAEKDALFHRVVEWAKDKAPAVMA
jgi:phage/plasmid-like protein (TIGR03299 family)